VTTVDLAARTDASSVVQHLDTGNTIFTGDVAGRPAGCHRVS